MQNKQEAVDHLCRVDKKMKNLIGSIGPMTLESESGMTPFAVLIKSVIHQQLSIKAAATIFRRFKELYGGKRFPRPMEVLNTSEELIRSVGISYSKIRSIHDIARKTLDKTVPGPQVIKRLENEEIIARLTQIRGVGLWTSEMLLIFYLGRQDVLPATDLGIRKGFAKCYLKNDLPTSDAVLKYGERWKPYRTTASWYLWRSLDSL